MSKFGPIWQTIERTFWKAAAYVRGRPCVGWTLAFDAVAAAYLVALSFYNNSLLLAYGPLTWDPSTWTIAKASGMIGRGEAIGFLTVGVLLAIALIGLTIYCFKRCKSNSGYRGSERTIEDAVALAVVSVASLVLIMLMFTFLNQPILVAVFLMVSIVGLAAASD